MGDVIKTKSASYSQTANWADAKLSSIRKGSAQSFGTDLNPSVLDWQRMFQASHIQIGAGWPTRHDNNGLRAGLASSALARSASLARETGVLSGQASSAGLYGKVARWLGGFRERDRRVRLAIQAGCAACGSS